MYSRANAVLTPATASGQNNLQINVKGFGRRVMLMNVVSKVTFTPLYSVLGLAADWRVMAKSPL